MVLHRITVHTVASPTFPIDIVSLKKINNLNHCELTTQNCAQN